MLQHRPSCLAKTVQAYAKTWLASRRCGVNRSRAKHRTAFQRREGGDGGFTALNHSTERASKTLRSETFSPEMASGFQSLTIPTPLGRTLTVSCRAGGNQHCGQDQAAHWRPDRLRRRVLPGLPRSGKSPQPPGHPVHTTPARALHRRSNLKCWGAKPNTRNGLLQPSSPQRPLPLFSTS